MSKKSNQWMDFLPEFRARLRKMYVISSLELTGILLAVCGILGGLGVALECKMWIPGIFVAGGIGVLLLFCIFGMKRKSQSWHRTNCAWRTSQWKSCKSG